MYYLLISKCLLKYLIAYLLMVSFLMKEKSQTLLSQEAKGVGPKDLLYICQRELAGTSTTDGDIFLCSFSLSPLF